MTRLRARAERCDEREQGAAGDDVDEREHPHARDERPGVADVREDRDREHDHRRDGHGAGRRRDRVEDRGAQLVAVEAARVEQQCHERREAEQPRERVLGRDAGGGCADLRGDHRQQRHADVHEDPQWRPAGTVEQPLGAQRPPGRAAHPAHERKRRGLGGGAASSDAACVRAADAF